MKRAKGAAAARAASRDSPPTWSQYLRKKGSILITSLSQKDDLHIDRAMLVEYLLRVGRLVVEGYVGTALLHELDFLLRAGGSNDFQAQSLGQLYNKSYGKKPQRYIGA